MKKRTFIAVVLGILFSLPNMFKPHFGFAPFSGIPNGGALLPTNPAQAFGFNLATALFWLWFFWSVYQIWKWWRKRRAQ